MKKLIYGGLFFALVGIGIVGCKKEISTKSDSATVNSGKQNTSLNKNGDGFSSDGRMLIFDNTEVYEAFLSGFMSETNDIGEADFIQHVNSMDYVSYMDKLVADGAGAIDGLGDNFMSAILNEDQIFQVGNFIYRVNKSAEKVFVLPADNISEYEDLVNESATNSNVRQFSTGDDVIELAEKGDLGEEKGVFCSDRKAKEKSTTSSNVTIMVNPFLEMYIKASYNKFGVYFTLKAEGTHQTASTSTYKFYFQIDNSSWAQRCGSSVSNYSHPWRTKTSGTQSGGVQTEKFLFYNGTKQLKNYHYRVRFRCENWLQPSSPNPYTIYFTSYVMIEDY